MSATLQKSRKSVRTAGLKTRRIFSGKSRKDWDGEGRFTVIPVALLYKVAAGEVALKDSDVFLYSVLRQIGWDHRPFEIKIDYLAMLTGWHRSKVRRRLDALKRAGLIERDNARITLVPIIEVWPELREYDYEPAPGGKWKKVPLKKRTKNRRKPKIDDKTNGQNREPKSDNLPTSEHPGCPLVSTLAQDRVLTGEHPDHSNMLTGEHLIATLPQAVNPGSCETYDDTAGVSRASVDRREREKEDVQKREKEREREREGDSLRSSLLKNPEVQKKPTKAGHLLSFSSGEEAAPPPELPDLSDSRDSGDDVPVLSKPVIDASEWRSMAISSSEAGRKRRGAKKRSEGVPVLPRAAAQVYALFKSKVLERHPKAHLPVVASGKDLKRIKDDVLIYEPETVSGMIDTLIKHWRTLRTTCFPPAADQDHPTFSFLWRYVETLSTCIGKDTLGKTGQNRGSGYDHTWVVERGEEQQRRAEEEEAALLAAGIDPFADLEAVVARRRAEFEASQGADEDVGV